MPEFKYFCNKYLNMRYYNFSGTITDNQYKISIDNRAFRYGDSIFESMYFTNNKIICLDKHWSRLQKGAALFNFDHLKISNADELEARCIELLNKNRMNGSARIRLQIFRHNGGLYLPENNDAEYIIEVSPLKNSEYNLNEEGLHIGIAYGVYKDFSYFSQIKTNSKQEMIIAAMQAKKNGWNDAIILNSKGRLVETSNSNIFIAKEGELFTPPLKDGPINGIMRQNVIESAKRLHIKLFEKSLSEKDLQQADEIFLTNSIRGIQWVKKFESLTFENIISNRLIKSLNDNYIQ